jgi:hypothetical protein
MAISCTVVIGPNSGTLILRRPVRMVGWSLDFNRSPATRMDRSFSLLPPCPNDKVLSESGLLRPAIIESFSFENVKYLRVSLG